MLLDRREEANDLLHFLAVAMLHVRAEIAPAILLIVDFGGGYLLDSKSSNVCFANMILHTQV